MKKVYIGMSTDFVHPGHLKMFREAFWLGELTVGLLTEEVIATYRRLPYLEFEHSRIIVESLKGVAHVVPQYQMDYRPNLRKMKPDYVVRGDDWREGPQKRRTKRSMTP